MGVRKRRIYLGAALFRRPFFHRPTVRHSRHNHLQAGEERAFASSKANSGRGGSAQELQAIVAGQSVPADFSRPKTALPDFSPHHSAALKAPTSTVESRSENRKGKTGLGAAAYRCCLIGVDHSPHKFSPPNGVALPAQPLAAATSGRHFIFRRLTVCRITLKTPDHFREHIFLNN